jgi:hypothetical protein
MIYFDAKSCGLIGDALAAVPFMIHAQEQDGEYAFVGPGFNAWVREGVWWPEKFQFDQDGAPFCARTVEVSPTRAWGAAQDSDWRLHMSEAHFTYNGLEMPVDLPFPAKHSEFAYLFDYAVAPFSRTDIAGNKVWPVEHWQQLISRLDGSVLVLGAHEDDTTPYEEAGATAIVGFNMGHVTDIVVNAAALITIDTGISHLAQLLQKREHVLLYPGTVPPMFAETRHGVHVRGPTMREISVDAVLAAVNSIHQKEFA